MDKQKIKIIRKNDEYSAEYQIGDIFQVDSTWYGGANVTSVSGIPLSLDKDEYVLLEEAEKEVPIDHYSYECGVMDCFCEMVASGLKKLAMSHPCDTKAERDSYLPQVKRLCEKYGILYHPQDEALITDLFPAEANQDKYNYLFFRTQDVYETYLELKKRQKELESQCGGTEEERYQLAVDFGALLSYPEQGIRRLIEKTREARRKRIKCSADYFPVKQLAGTDQTGTDQGTIL